MYDSGMLPLGPLTELQKKRAEDDADKMNLKQKARDQAAAARQSRSNPKPNEAFYENVNKFLISQFNDLIICVVFKKNWHYFQISGAAAEEHRKKRRTGPTFTGKSEHFDFDAWYKHKPFNIHSLKIAALIYFNQQILTLVQFKNYRTKAHYSETFTRGTRARFRAKLEETTVSERFRRIDTAVSLTFIFAVFYLGWYATSLSTSDISHVKPPKDDR